MNYGERNKTTNLVTTKISKMKLYNLFNFTHDPGSN